MNELNQNPKEKKNLGGKRAGAGRPKGVKDRVTIQGLLETLDELAPGQTYEDLLIQDFLNARNSGDKSLTIKYHNLILNKVMATLNQVEVNDTSEAVEAKQVAFAEALKSIVENSKDK